jgi:hypothetical protein
MSRPLLIVPLALSAWLGATAVVANEVDALPHDPVAFARVAAAQLQRALPDLHVEARDTAVVFSGRDGENLGMTVADRATLCRERPDDCSEPLARFVASNTKIFRGVADAHTGHREAPDRAEPMLTHAVWADERAWLLSASGDLSSIAPGGTSADRETLPEAVVGLCAEGDRPVVATCKQPGCRSWTLRRRVAGQWRPFATVASAKDEVIGLSCSADQETLVTTRRLVEVATGREHAVSLSEVLPSSDTAVVLARRDAIYVGFNQGAQGGGLRRVDPRSGRVTLLQQSAPGRPCLGLLTPSCDPVQAIVTTPWDPACVAVAVGLVHRQTHGRIVEVCGDTLRRLYVQRAGVPSPREKPDAPEPALTMAFMGLGVTGDELVAVGSDGSLHRIARDGTAQLQPPAAYHRMGEVSASFDVPDVVLVLTDVFRHDSLGGSLPMLIPR